MIRRSTVRLALLASTALALGGAAPPATEGPTAAEFVPVPPMTVAIIDGASMTGRIDLKLVLLAATPEDAAKVTEDLPDIQTHLLGATSDFGLWMGNPSVPIDVVELSRRLDAAVPAHTRVLVQQVSASPA